MYSILYCTLTKVLKYVFEKYEIKNTEPHVIK